MYMLVVMVFYFGGFLLGLWVVLNMIQKVGYVCVFVVFGLIILLVLIFYVFVLYWIVWVVMWLLIGFCFLGVYIIVESWLNVSVCNEMCGQVMLVYMIVQMLGIIVVQLLMNIVDLVGYLLFLILLLLVSVLFLLILLLCQFVL